MTWVSLGEGPKQGMLSFPRRLLPLLAALAAAAPMRAQPAHAHILGVTEPAYYVHDMARARQFYEGFLGFAEPFSLNNPDGSLAYVWVKINDHQTIELRPEKAPNTDRLVHIAFETDNAEALRLELTAKGMTVSAIHASKTGAAHFALTDPDGHAVEFIQYLPGGWMDRDRGRHLPATRVSMHMSHFGIMVHNLTAAQHFYHDLLGFTETWRGSGNGQRLSWVNMRVPDGTDWVEFMLYDKMPTLAHVGVSHHYCLITPDVTQASALLSGRPLPAGATYAPAFIVGTDKKRQIHAFDPDGTRVEIMEPGPADGIPAPSSAAPPPGA